MATCQCYDAQLPQRRSWISKAMNVLAANWRRWLPITAIGAAFLLAFGFELHSYVNFDWLAEQRDWLKGQVAENFVLALGGYALAYIIAVAIAFPAPSMLTVFAGFLFGWPTALVMVVISATLGAALLFLATRSALGVSLRQRLGPKVDRLAKGFERDALIYIIALRIAPILPFWLVTVAPAFFKVPIKTFMIATFLGTMPGTFTLAYLGSGLESVIDNAASRGETITPADLVTPQIAAAFGFFVVLAIIPAVVRYIIHLRGQKLPDEQ